MLSLGGSTSGLLSFRVDQPYCTTIEAWIYKSAWSQITSSLWWLSPHMVWGLELQLLSWKSWKVALLRSRGSCTSEPGLEFTKQSSNIRLEGLFRDQKRKKNRSVASFWSSECGRQADLMTAQLVRPFNGPRLQAVPSEPIFYALFKLAKSICTSCRPINPTLLVSFFCYTASSSGQKQQLWHCPGNLGHTLLAAYTENRLHCPIRFRVLPY
jgi:hypothetical protein